MNVNTVLKEKVALKEGKMKAININGDIFYAYPVEGKNILEDAALNVPMTIEYDVESRGGKDYLVIKTLAAGTPSLPQTKVSATVAPGGEPPVAPAKSKKTETKSSYGGDFQKPWLPEEAHRVGVLNVLTATLQSPAVGQACVGKSDLEVKATLRDMFLSSLALYEEKKNPA